MVERDDELGFKLRLENIAATEKFDEVLDVAIETCLAGTKIYDAALKAVDHVHNEMGSSEQSLMQRLGPWGLRAAVDISMYEGSFYLEALDDLPPPLMSGLPYEPSIVPLANDKEVQNKIEAFGVALIREAFSCLGEDAPEKARQFAEATDAAEQREILGWLYERISRIRELMPVDEETIEDIPEPTLVEVNARLSTTNVVEDDPIIVDFRDETVGQDPMEAEITAPLPRSIQTDQDDAGNYFYHPTRLSPKLIGVFPENHIRTTCLGVSVLAAAFFEAAEAKYVHAGVMETSLEATRMTQLHSILGTFAVAEDNGFGLNNTADKNLTDIAESINNLRRSDRGHHAMTVVQLTDGNWVQFDPNYNAIDMLTGSDSSGFGVGYDQLASLEKVERGMNLIQRSGKGRTAEFYMWAIDDLLQLNLDELESRLDVIMDSDDVISGLKDYLLEVASHLSTFETVFEVFVALTNNKSKEARADMLFEQCVERYFMAGMDVKEMTALYKSDPAFRKRREEDFAMLPYMMILKSLSEFAYLQTKGLLAPSATLEVGMPAFRIGACVLSDFSIYLGNEVPLSFWVANWPSHVAVEAHLPAKNDDSPQAELGRRMSSLIRSGLLRHFTSYGIIHKFLEQGENESDGNRQG